MCPRYLFPRRRAKAGGPLPVMHALPLPRCPHSPELAVPVVKPSVPAFPFAAAFASGFGFASDALSYPSPGQFVPSSVLYP